MLPQTKQTITSLELMDQINLFRKEEGKETELQHRTLLTSIRDEFSEEIGMQKILQTHYTHPQNKQEYPMFVLTLSQAKQVLVRESKFVRKHVIAYLEQLEEAVRNSNNNLSEKDKYLLDIFRSKDEVEMITNLFKFDRGYVRPLEGSRT